MILKNFIMSAGKYKSQAIEKKWQDKWEKEEVYKWDSSEPRENTFVIDTPPPGVSGMLHMGHVFSYTHTDFIARFQRMSGKNVFYPMGFDDNGLPTERLVEKVKKVRAANVSRQEFINMCEEVIEGAEEQFRELFRTIALSVDWSQEYQTISPQSRKLSQMSFIDLYNKGHIEKRDAPTFWDCIDRTAIAQAEIEDHPKDGVMNYITFKAESGDNLTIATTRPELIPACVAVFYHPEDERYKQLQSAYAITPIYENKVAILADEDVDPEKGSGLVMCCTFGDIQDIEWWRRHKLDIKDCVGKNGRMQNAGELDGLKVKEAKEVMIAKLEETGSLQRQEPITQAVKCAERSKAPLEIISTNQWYVKVLDKKKELLEQSAKCKWHPEYMKIRLDNWIEGLNQDWCISRQRYFGVPFPAWYSKRKGEEGKILFADIDQLPVDPLVDLPKGYSKDEVEPDTDVMDTWATSSVSPQLNTLGISDDLHIDLERHKKLFPCDLRPQAHEIIRTWSFYTIVKAYLHQGQIPWYNIMLSGWCLAEDKAKMSKSRGNVVTPKDVIEQNGSDITRYWASTSKLGTDTAYNTDVFKVGKKLVTKLWNAAKFAKIHIDNISGTPSSVKADIASGVIYEDLDLWVLSKIHKAIVGATKSFEAFEYCDARVYVEDFFWNDFCDNYLELVKKRSYNEGGVDDKAQQSAIYTIYHCLKTVLILFAPFVPHITDELNEMVFNADKSLQKRGSWAKFEDYYHDADKAEAGQDVTALLELVRKFKSNANLALNAPIHTVEFSGCKLSDSLVADLKNASGATQIIACENVTGDNILESEKYKINVILDE